MPSFDTPQPIAVTVEVALGDVHVTASERIDTVATVEPTDPSKPADVAAAENTRIDYVDGRLVIATPRSWRRFSPFDNPGAVQVAIEVPTGSTIDASSSLGDIRVDGELDRCQVKTSMGNIQLDNCGLLEATTSFGDVDVDHVHGDADVTTSSGAVDIGIVDGAAVVKNSNGATAIGRVTGDVRVKAANGRITIHRAERSVVAKSAAGSIEVGSLRRGVATLETSVGDITCGLADGTAANLDVRSRSGRIHSGLEASNGPGENDEVLELHAHTTVGDITLFRTGDRARDTR